MKSIQQAQKRPNKHKLNNSIVGITGWHGRSIKRLAKRVKNGLKKAKLIIKQGPTQERSETKNESSRTSSRMCKRALRLWQTHE